MRGASQDHSEAGTEAWRDPQPRAAPPREPDAPGRRTSAEQAEVTLRLVRDGGEARPPLIQPISQAADPRWVLAVRTAECLQGTILPPEKRERLIRIGRTFGLTSFDCNLIIAIIQDQARRGVLPQVCPRAGLEQLSMVRLPESRPLRGLPGPRRLWAFALTLTVLVAIELLLIFGWFG